MAKRKSSGSPSGRSLFATFKEMSDEQQAAFFELCLNDNGDNAVKSGTDVLVKAFLDLRKSFFKVRDQPLIKHFLGRDISEQQAMIRLALQSDNDNALKKVIRDIVIPSLEIMNERDRRQRSRIRQMDRTGKKINPDRDSRIVELRDTQHLSFGQIGKDPEIMRLNNGKMNGQHVKRTYDRMKRNRNAG